jgi:hypothetical protein
LNGSAPNAAVESNLTFDGTLLNVTGRISASAGITGSLLGTSSWAQNAVTATSFSGSLQVVGLAEIGEGLIVSGGLDVNGGITGSLLGTSSWATNAVSSSFATTASFALTPSGTSGTAGSSGTSGANGSSGTSGTSGSSGTSGTGFTTITNAADNRVLTSDGTVNAAVAETNITFDGTLLNVTGRISASAGITGSLFGTSSWASNAVSSSFATTASFALTSAGGGGGTKTLAVFTPLDNQPPASNFATLDTRNSVMVLDFDASTDEQAVFVGVIPEAAVLTSGITVRLFWAATSATSGACRWDVQFEDTVGHDIDADGFDTIASATTTTSGTSGAVNLTSITITTIDSLVAGDAFRLRVNRDANNAADTMTGDAELVAVEVRAT